MSQVFNPERIAIFRFSSLGDAILSSVVFEPVRKAFPDAQISFVTGEPYQELFKGHKHINSTIDVHLLGSLKDEIRSFRKLWNANFDLIIDLHNNLRSKWLKRIIVPGTTVTWENSRKERHSQVRGKEMPGLDRTFVTPVWRRYLDTLHGINITTHNYEVPQSLLQIPLSSRELTNSRIRTDRMIGIAFGAKHATKRWPMQHFIEMVNAITDMDYSVVLIGSEFEYFLGESIKGNNDGVFNAAGLPLKEIAGIIGECKAVVANDSGLAHLAEAVGVPVVMLFGGTHPVLGFGPHLNQSKALTLDLPCSPCHVHGQKLCPLGHFKCMNDLSSEMVLSELTNILDK